jgi:hypothetical protein
VWNTKFESIKDGRDHERFIAESQYISPRLVPAFAAGLLNGRALPIDPAAFFEVAKIRYYWHEECLYSYQQLADMDIFPDGVRGPRNLPTTISMHDTVSGMDVSMLRQWVLNVGDAVTTTWSHRYRAPLGPKSKESKVNNPKVWSGSIILTTPTEAVIEYNFEDGSSIIRFLPPRAAIDASIRTSAAQAWQDPPTHIPLSPSIRGPRPAKLQVEYRTQAAGAGATKSGQLTLRALPNDRVKVQWSFNNDKSSKEFTWWGTVIGYADKVSSRSRAALSVSYDGEGVWPFPPAAGLLFN